MGESQKTPVMALNDYIMINDENRETQTIILYISKDWNKDSISYQDALRYIDEFAPFHYYVANEISSKTKKENQFITAYAKAQKKEFLDEEQKARFMKVNEGLGVFADATNQWLTDRVVKAVEIWKKSNSNKWNPKISSGSFTESGRGLKSYLYADVTMEGDISPFSISAFLWKGESKKEGNEVQPRRLGVSLELWAAKGKANNQETNSFQTYCKDIVKQNNTLMMPTNGRLLYAQMLDEGKDNKEVEAYIKDAIDKLWEHYLQFVDDNLVAKKIDNIIHDGFGHRQIILNGAPGTGKTYAVQKYAERWNVDQDGNQRKDKDSHFQIIQFHPSYDYTDFVEGIRPIQKETGMSYEKLDGHFMAFCRKVVLNGLDKARNKSGNQELIIDDVLQIAQKIEKGEEVKEVEKKAYEAFRSVEGEEEELYFFIIDEINRADISKVLGELMYGLEYRGVTRRFPTQYQNLKTFNPLTEDIYKGKEDCFKDGFFIPENVIILGTMNDIDKSVESFDFAMRRRFQWYEVKVDKESLINAFIGMLCEGELNKYNKHQAEIDGLADCICEMNKVVSDKKYKLSEAYHIGPAYFKSYKLSQKGSRDAADKGQLKKIFENTIAPTLQEYVRGQINIDAKAYVEACKIALTEK